MWIQVRSMDGKKCERIKGLSKLTRIEELRRLVAVAFDAPPHLQRLFYRGKQLEDDHTLFEYDVNLNDIVQVMIRSKQDAAGSAASCVGDHEKHDGHSSGYESSSSTNVDDDQPLTKKDDKFKKTDDDEPKKNVEVSASCCYKVGDYIDAKDAETGSWFEGKIVKIEQEVDGSLNENAIKELNNNVKSVPFEYSDTVSESNNSQATDISDYESEFNEMSFTFHITYDGYEDMIVKLKSKNIRPRARALVSFEDIKIGDVVMVNYNIDEPQERGIWFDVCVINVGLKDLTATVFMGWDTVPLANCRIIFTDEIYRIERAVNVTERTPEQEHVMQESPPPKRSYKPTCSECNDNARRRCKFCACCVCGKKEDPDKQLLCDECNSAFHLWCLDPPLDALPTEEEWYCPSCKNDETEVVRAGEKLKDSKKKARLPSAVSHCTRDWGKGMACVGRTRECTIVPPNHIGPVPGVEVGMSWLFRVQVSEVGIHRPHVAGIHGRATEGAFSLVMAGGYEDDVDHGDEFTYTGSGGRDLSGNKRTAEQSSDQELTRYNRALALNCAAPMSQSGGEAADWRKGRPVRVIRSSKGRKFSTYCPEEGNRYDGLYKIVKYWPEKGKSGYLVWRYFLRRDDPSPSPWSHDGMARMKQLGIKLQYPEGYLETREDAAKTPAATPNRSDKRKSIDETTENESKRSKSNITTLPENLEALICKDEENSRLWSECQEVIPEGTQKFVRRVEEVFNCVCCQEVVYKPVTTLCKHNICQSCLSRSFKSGVYTCPVCRFDLGKNYQLEVNVRLRRILQFVLVGYENGR